MKTLKRPRLNHSWLSQTIAILGFLAVFILSAGVGRLHFKPGQPLPTTIQTLPQLPIEMSFQWGWLLNLFLVLILTTVPLSIILFIFSAEARQILKKYFKTLIVWLILLLSIRLLTVLFNHPNSTSSDTTSPPSLPDPSVLFSIPTGETPSAPETYTPPFVTEQLRFLIGFVLAFILGFVIYYFWITKRSQENDLKTIAVNALRQIDEGRQWEDAIIQCYAQMNSVVSHKKQIERPAFLTPAEFARELASAGLPSEPVASLTRLFEHARYGSNSTRPTDAREAVDCLSQITQALEAVK
jgi:hypothetical protein